jgi:hypothetical protein
VNVPLCPGCDEVVLLAVFSRRELLTSQAAKFTEELMAIKTDKLGSEMLHCLTHLFFLL